MSLTVTQAATDRLRETLTARPRVAQIEWAVVAALTLGAFLLRLSQIHQSLFSDEIWAYQEIVGHGFRAMVHDVRTGIESSPPLFFAFAWLSVKLGDPTVLIRLPTLILGTALVPLTYLLGRETMGRAAGVVAAAFLAFSPFSVYYGVEARPYATMAFFVVLSTFALLRAVRSGAWQWWALYACAAAGAAYTHYTAIFVLLVQAAWALWVCRDRLRKPLIASAGAALLYVPWLPFVHGSDLGTYGSLQPLTAINVLRDLGRVIAGYPYTSIRVIPTWLGMGVILLLALGGAALMARMHRVNERTPGEGIDPPVRQRIGELMVSRRTLLVALSLATPVGLLLYSILFTDLWLARGIYSSVPYAYIGLAALLLAFPARVRVAAVGIALVVLVLATVRSLAPQYVRPAYRQIAAYLDRVAPPRDPVVYEVFWSAPDLAVQYHEPHTIWNTPPKSWNVVPPGTTAWVVTEDRFLAALHAPPPDPPGFTLVGRRSYRGWVPITIYGFRRAASS